MQVLNASVIRSKVFAGGGCIPWSSIFCGEAWKSRIPYRKKRTLCHRTKRADTTIQINLIHVQTLKDRMSWVHCPLQKGVDQVRACMLLIRLSPLCDNSIMSSLYLPPSQWRSRVEKNVRFHAAHPALILARQPHHAPPYPLLCRAKTTLEINAFALAPHFKNERMCEAMSFRNAHCLFNEPICPARNVRNFDFEREVHFLFLKPYTGPTYHHERRQGTCTWFPCL